MSVSEVKQPDQKRIVATLAADSDESADEIEKLYELERARLAIGAHTTKFLHIFAIRNVQEILRKRSIERPAAQSGSRPLPVASRLSGAPALT